MQRKYNFIKLEKVILRHFSLYKRKGKLYEVNEEINDGVYCLAGANGLGKTTFLNSINYGLTGIVLEPDKKVYAPNEIVTSNKRYTERYFKGRIESKNEKDAEIEILFKVNEKYFRIVRGFFEREELREFEMFSGNNSKKIPLFKSKKESPKELNTQFQKLLANEIGFASFDYFIFYQLYVFTFDENRRLLFWDVEASRLALSIVFNSTPEDTQKLLETTRLLDKYESKAKNLRYQAGLLKKKADELAQKTKGKSASKIEKLEKEFAALSKEIDKQQKVRNNIAIEYDSLLKKQSHLNSELMQLRIEHTRLFSKYSKPRSILLENTNVQLSIKNKECCLCGSEGLHILESIERSIHKEKCPLCNTTINESKNAELNNIFKLIQKNDEEILKKTSDLDNTIHEVESKKTQLDKADIELNKLKRRLDDFVEDNPDVSFKGTGDLGIDGLIEQYRKQFDLTLKESKDEYAKRDKLQPKYETLLKKVEIAYKSAETIFVPIFKKLAYSFIGLKLSIRSVRDEDTIKLVLELNDAARTESFQLSESQRFFLDIALRMSLAIFLSNKNEGATMMVDTPEGSLDIAYESRVGNMFAEYVNDYHQNLFMTANINASQLLLSLAEKCGKRNMKFKRMLDWTDPNPIQKEGEDLFQKVYNSIDLALNKKR